MSLGYCSPPDKEDCQPHTSPPNGMGGCEAEREPTSSSMLRGYDGPHSLRYFLGHGHGQQESWGGDGEQTSGQHNAAVLWPQLPPATASKCSFPPTTGQQLGILTHPKQGCRALTPHPSPLWHFPLKCQRSLPTRPLCYRRAEEGLQLGRVKRRASRHLWISSATASGPPCAASTILEWWGEVGLSFGRSWPSPSPGLCVGQWMWVAAPRLLLPTSVGQPVCAQLLSEEGSLLRQPRKSWGLSGGGLPFCETTLPTGRLPSSSSLKGDRFSVSEEGVWTRSDLAPAL